MSGAFKLEAEHRHILKIASRDVKPDGWCVVSKMLYPVLSKNMPPELIIFEALEDGSGRCQLTEKGKNILDAMEWL